MKNAPETHVRCRVCGRWYQILSWTHLRRHQMTPEDYKKRFGVDYVSSDEMRQRMSLNSRLPRHNTGYRPLRRRAILSAIRRYLRSRRPAPHSLKGQAVHVFGSWREALKAANCEPLRKRWTLQAIRKGLRSWIRRHGPLNDGELKSTDSSLHASVCGRFGTVEAAAGALSLPYSPRCTRWSRKRLMNEIKKRARKGLSLSSKAVEEEDSRLSNAARRRFGSWEKAVRACGLDYTKIRIRKERSPEALGRQLRAWCRKNGPLNDTDLHADDSALHASAEAMFGSIKKAAAALGLPHFRRRRTK